MKNLITLVLIVLMSTELMAYSGGSGTVEDPYQIATLADLNELSSTYGDWDKHYIQTNNINASATVNQDNGAGFMPIGTEAIYFTGTYNGNGYTIDGLYINRASMDYVGLFSYPYGATIENLGVTNVNVTGNNAVGALAGINATSSLINNCYSTGSVTAYEKAGGLAGENYNNSIISNSYSTCTVKATTWYYAGGFVGLNFYSNSTIYNCYSTGDVEGQEYVGGFIGSTDFSTSVYSCYSTGNVRATNEAGGFIGLNTNSSTVHDCYSLGDVTLISYKSNPSIGGFCGWNNETIANCYSVGSVFYEGATNPTNRGFLGYKGNGSVYNNNFFDNESSNQTSDEYGGATAKSTVEMKNEATFTDLNTVGLTTPWDFVSNPYDDQGNNDYWDIDRASTINNGYPFLSWENGNDTSLPVGLTSFTAESQNGCVLLKWSTASEVNNDAFLLERSEDNENFELIAEIKGQGSTSKETKYSFSDNSVFNGFTYYYRLADRNIKGIITYHTTVNATPNAQVDFDQSSKIVEKFVLRGNYPNPFNPETTVRFDIPTATDDLIHIRLTVYNSLGQLVTTLYEGQISGGQYELKWNASNQPSGIYFLNFQSEKFVQSQKMILLR